LSHIKNLKIFSSLYLINKFLLLLKKQKIELSSKHTQGKPLLANENRYMYS